jgi:hypothetical protein
MSMSKLGKWHVGSFAALGVVVIAAALFAKESISPSVYGVCTVGYNYRGRVFGRWRGCLRMLRSARRASKGEMGVWGILRRRPARHPS